MTPTTAAVLRSWPFEPWVLGPLLLTAWVYLRGWAVLRRRDPHRWPPARLAAFGAGLAAVFLALASPVEPFASLLLQVHMGQHLLLMMVAPPFLWLGAPFFPLLRGLPRPVRTVWVAPLVRSPVLRRLAEIITHPVAAWLLFTATTWAWHLPPVYDLALRSAGWHYAQHACFLGAGLVFWHPVVRPYPSRPAWSPWLLLPYLLLADVQNTALSAVLTFADEPLYSRYVEQPRLGNLSALDDQAAAGVLMWVPGSLVFLGPLFVIGLQLLYGRDRPKAKPARLALPVIGPPPAFDALRVPLLGRFLRWRYARLALQIPLLLLAAAVVYDGFRGPPVGAANLAGVLPWVHWRGLVVLGLLAAGNVFCMGCPFLLPRTLARRWLPAGRAWPAWLRTKWPAVALLVGFLWAYEACALWDRPGWTAGVVVAYFAAAFVIDGTFRGAAFCKYVCPIGQFNFVQSLVSPLEIKVRDPAVCASCRTKDCIRGRDGIPGCELHLFQPRKAGNLDCTFCLDCVHACPHDNVGVLAVTPGAELWRDPQRSGVGRLSRRPDVAALVVVLAFGAFVNAAGMTGPVVAAQDGLSAATTAGLYLAALVVLPVVLVWGAAALSRWWGRLDGDVTAVATRYAYAFIPLGFGMWLTHYTFHFLTSYDALIPAAQRFAADLGWRLLGSPEWYCACCVPVAGWLLRLEIVFLDLGLLLSLYTAYRIALMQSPRLPRALAAFAPWAVLIVLLFAAGVWVVFQPMQMRGTMLTMG